MQGLSLAEGLRERRCRRLAQERGAVYEQVLREDLVQHEPFWADHALQSAAPARSTRQRAGHGLDRRRILELRGFRDVAERRRR